jgi:hypothetical protein
LSGAGEDKKLGTGFLGLKKWGGLGTRGFLKTYTRDQPRPTRIVQILTKIYDFNTKIQTLWGGAAGIVSLGRFFLLLVESHIAWVWERGCAYIEHALSLNDMRPFTQEQNHAGLTQSRQSHTTWSGLLHVYSFMGQNQTKLFSKIFKSDLLFSEIRLSLIEFL